MTCDVCSSKSSGMIYIWFAFSKISLPGCCLTSILSVIGWAPSVYSLVPRDSDKLSFLICSWHSLADSDCCFLCPGKFISSWGLLVLRTVAVTYDWSKVICFSKVSPMPSKGFSKFDWIWMRESSSFDSKVVSLDFLVLWSMKSYEMGH